LAKQKVDEHVSGGPIAHELLFYALKRSSLMGECAPRSLVHVLVTDGIGVTQQNILQRSRDSEC